MGPEHRKRRLLGSLLLLLGAGASAEEPGVVEATPPASESPAAESAGGPRESRSRLVDEIIVTAQKREEHLEDVPVSVQAFSEAALDARGVTDATRLAQVTPSLTLSDGVGFAIIFLRGVGSDTFLLGDPSVAYYADNVYMPFSQGLVQQFGSVERIEVLKGPQGTLFGRNAVGGAINVISRKPDLQDAFTSIQTSYGNYDQWQNRVYTNLPLADSLALNVSALYNHGDYWQDIRIGGESQNQIISRGARVRLRWVPTDDLDFVLSGVRYLQDGAGPLAQLNVEPSPLSQLLGIRPQTGYDGDLDAPVYQTIDDRIVYGEGTWSTSWLDARILGSHQEIDTGAVYDFDGSAVPVIYFGGRHLGSDVKSAEFQLLSNESTWGADRLQWIVGYYFFKSEGGYYGGAEAVVPIADDLRTALLSLAPDILLPPLLTLPSGRVAIFGLLGTRSTAFYGQFTLKLTDWASLTLGGRYQDEDRTILEMRNALFNGDGTTTPIYPAPDPFVHEGKKITTDGFKPKASLEFRPGDETLVYLTYQQAIKSGTFNVVRVAQPPDEIRPEKMDAYELGLKTALFDGVLSLSAAAFHYEIENLQVQYVSALNGGVITFENAPEAEVDGVDFDATMRVLPGVFDDLVFTLGGAYIHGRYTRYPQGSGFDEQTGIFGRNFDFTDNRIARTPEWSFSGTLGKTWQVPGGSLELTADFYTNSGFYYSAQNTPKSDQEDYHLFGAQISYLYERWGLRATVFGRNISDEYYSTGALLEDFGTNISLGPPAMYGLRLNWDF
ncbi:MAG TPA: TonB-dependent receptor [Nevskiaceae bacterium]|nr:TonB-dependent receptor [Nevskiaceae bacterium]